ncbi:MBL fold metallo-hydrolase [Patescibacteria group bacterium]|nr:MBL fold metallo-hydrolase [Patescibacteria group bacterium]
MHITFIGATREVTGSCYLVETEKTRLLVDCGMFQGGAFCEARNFAKLPFDASTVEAVCITHAHLDHTGRLPKLVGEGFKGKIYLTPPTAPLAKLVLEDAFQIMSEANRREHRPMLYEEPDIINAIQQFRTVEYNRPVMIGDLTVYFREAGHIFGSAFLEIEEKGGSRVAFSGDLGNDHVPILRDTAQLGAIDALVIESTYGDKIHEDESSRSLKLKDVIMRTVEQKGVLLIPAFAIERTQQLLYEMNHLVENHEIPRIDTYLDSPMAIGATEVLRDFPQYYDPEALAEVSSGDDLFDFPGLHVCRSRDQSMEINGAPWPKIIISGSGMMNGGRILHHLVRYLGDKRNTVLIVGYQAKGTLGRKLFEGYRTVHVLGQQVIVEATIIKISAYSAHADKEKLVRWVSEAKRLPARVFCTHGEEGTSLALAEILKTELHVDAQVPTVGQTVTV